MGQKVNPIGLRIGITRGWDSVWYARRNFGAQLQQDLFVRRFVQQRLASAGVARVVIERLNRRLHIAVHAARPGVVIGKKGADIDRLRQDIKALSKDEVQINVIEVRKPEIDATLVAENLAQQLERRVGFRRAMKRAVQSAMRMGALGIRISCAGRLGGAEIARTEVYREGRVPLHTFRADVDYSYRVAQTTYGVIGVKVWIFKGEVLGNHQDKDNKDKEARPQRARREMHDGRETKSARPATALKPRA